MGSDENEDFPLLRKSPDSGSYVSLAMDSDKEPKQMPDAVNTGVNESSRYNASHDADNNAGSIPENVHTDKTSTVNDERNNDKRVDDAEMPSEDSSLPASVEKLKHDCVFPVEYCDTEYENLRESNVVSSGLNQSKSSISENPSYSYGNQMEYSPYSGFGYGYSNAFDNDVIKNDRFEVDWMGKSGFVSNLLENEGIYRANGTCDAVTNELPDALSNYIHSSDHSSSSKASNANDVENRDNTIAGRLPNPNRCLSVVPHQPVLVTNQPNS